MKLFSIIFVSLSICFCSAPQNQSPATRDENKASIKTGADQTEKYLPYLKGKRVAIMANLTTLIGKTH
jgi:uncharacterized protein YbbC (DUF1343 family)